MWIRGPGGIFDFFKNRRPKISGHSPFNFKLLFSFSDTRNGRNRRRSGFEIWPRFLQTKPNSVSGPNLQYVASAITAGSPYCTCRSNWLLNFDQNPVNNRSFASLKILISVVKFQVNGEQWRAGVGWARKESYHQFCNTLVKITTINFASFRLCTRNQLQ
jgi:hypothetical protein